VKWRASTPDQGGARPGNLTAWTSWMLQVVDLYEFNVSATVGNFRKIV
jgi:hypothetical protein